MTQSSWLRVFMLGAFLFSFTLVGCGGDEEEGVDEATEVDVETDGDVAASGDMDEMKEAMLEMTKEMHDIVTSIESVEDVQEADEEIGEIFDELIENLREAMKGDPAAMQQMGMHMENDPEMNEWSEKMDAAMAKLKADHPEAAAELETTMQKHSMKLMTLMGEMMQQMAPEEMEGMMEGSGETPAEGEDMSTGEEPGEPGE